MNGIQPWFRRSAWRSRTLGRMACGLILLLQMWPVGAGVGQVPSADQATPGFGRPRLGNEDNKPSSPFEQSAARKLEKMREDDRRKRLLADTARLVALSNELQSEVDKASKDELSLDVVRKAAEIEKLAHDVKERMKG